MRNLNVYYVVSVISLAFMMLILFRTLEIRGWFDKHGGKSPAEYFKAKVTGHYDLDAADAPEQKNRTVTIVAFEEQDYEWIVLTVDSLVQLRLKVSDFEDEQVLVELFRFDTTGKHQRLEGCEILLSDDESGVWTGSTIGESCGYSRDLMTYYSLKLHVALATIKVEIESLKYEDQTRLDRKEYLLKRSDKNE